MAGGAERLADACNREPWLVTLAEVGRWFELSYQSLERGFWRPKWQLLAGSQDGQRLLSGSLRRIRPRRNTRLYASPRFLHPWQMGQQLSDLQLIRRKHASLVTVIPPNSLVLHAPSCWSDAKWDEVPSNYATQIWYLPHYDKSRRSGVCTTATAGRDANLPLRIQHNLKLGKWDSRLYDFYSSVDDPPRPLQCYL